MWLYFIESGGKLAGFVMVIDRAYKEPKQILTCPGFSFSTLTAAKVWVNRLFSKLRAYTKAVGSRRTSLKIRPLYDFGKKQLMNTQKVILS